MAPLVATVATSLAVGVGLLLARTGRERRGARGREAGQQLGLLAGEPLADGLRRMALEQLDLALALLGEGRGANHGAGGGASHGADGSWNHGAGGAPDEEAVHETRKAIKRLRALLRLLRHELGERAYTRESDTLRDVAHRLSGARDATVMLATLDALIERHPGRLGRRRGVSALRRRLAAESARVQQLTLTDPGERAEALGELHALRWRVSAWSLPAGDGLRLIDADLQRLYEQGRRRLRRVARGGKGRTLAMHMWRKRVKDLRYAAEMLQRADAAGNGLRKLAARADDLGELLGEEHDLAVLAEHLRAGAKRGRRARGAQADQPALWRTGRRTRRALLRAIAKRRRKLRKRAQRKGEVLYRDKPARFMRRVRREHQRAAAAAGGRA